MTDVVAFEDLVGSYVDQVRAHLSPDSEYAYAVGYIAALTNPVTRFSAVARLQHVRAVVAAVDRIRSERKTDQ